MKKILVIEDEQDVRENIKTLLEEEGYKVFSTDDGKEGILLAEEIHPDLIICDVMMKKVDGYEVIKKLSARPDTAVIPFVFLTARAEKEDLRTGMELGADDYLFKPFKAETLLRAIQVRLAKHDMLQAELVDKEEAGLNKKKLLNMDDRIFVKVNEEILFIAVGDIKYIAAENQYSYLHMKQSKAYLLRMPLSKWEEKLSEKNFFRINRSTIININFIDKIEKWFNNSLKVYIKNTGEPFIVSKNYVRKFNAIF